MEQVVDAIHRLPQILHRDAHQQKVLSTQVPNFRGSKDKFNEFEHLLLNHLRPHQNRLTEEAKLQYFQSLLRDEAIEFWQTLRINSETTLKDVLQLFNKEFTKDDFREVSKYKWNQITYDPTKENFGDFLKNLKKVAKQAFGDKAPEYVETFLFGKLPVQIQHELSTAGKADATVDEIKTFIQRRFQYQQLMPQKQAHPFNEVSTNQTQQQYQPRQKTNERPHYEKRDRTVSQERQRFDGDCFYCGKRGHKEHECRAKKRGSSQCLTNNRDKNGENDRQTTIQLPISLPNLWLYWTFGAGLQTAYQRCLCIQKHPV